MEIDRIRLNTSDADDKKYINLFLTTFVPNTVGRWQKSILYSSSVCVIGIYLLMCHVETRIASDFYTFRCAGSNEIINPSNLFSRHREI